MAYEKKTGLVDLQKLENDSELTTVSAGTAKATKYICYIHSKVMKPLCVPIPVPVPVPEEPAQR